MLSPTELLQSYHDYLDEEGDDNQNLDSSVSLELITNDSRAEPVISTTRQVYYILATAICMHWETLLIQGMRSSIAAAVKFRTKGPKRPCSNKGDSGRGSASSEMATITAMDLPETLRFFSAYEGRQRSGIGGGGVDSGNRFERLLVRRLRDAQFPGCAARMLSSWQLAKFLHTVIDQVSGRLFNKLFASGDCGPIVESSSDQTCDASAAAWPRRRRRHRRRAPAMSGDVGSDSSATATVATSSAAALNTDGSNSYRKPAPEQPRQTKPHPATVAGQRLCRLHAGSFTNVSASGGESSSCAVCASRHFLQQHLGRICREPESLAKLEWTLRDCMQLQSRWGKSLQWIAANMKESRLSEFVRPLVTAEADESGAAKPVAVNPHITTDGHVSTRWAPLAQPDKK